LSDADPATLQFPAFALRLCDPCKFPKDIANIQEVVDSLSENGTLRFHPIVFRKLADTASAELEQLRNTQRRIPSLMMDFRVDVNRDKELEESLVEFTDVYIVDVARIYIATKPVSKTVVYEEYTFLYRTIAADGKPTRDHAFMKSKFIAPFVMPGPMK
jgi:type VI protein secretion system component Hcp